MRAALFLLLLAGCRQLLGFENPTVAGEDAMLDPDVLVIPDAGPCQSVSATCEAGIVLRECTVIGEQPTDTTCAWGCVETNSAHCGALVPSGGAVSVADLTPEPALAEVTIPNPNAVLDTDAGTITNIRGAGTGVVDGIDFAQRNNVGIFRLKKLTVNGLLLIRGSRAAAIIATEGDISIANIVDARGSCAGTDAGPGGARGGNSGADGQGPGSGKNGQGNGADASGGGGGGYGVSASRGGNGGGGSLGGAAGVAYGNPQISTLVGGSGGGGGAKAGEGGAGGGGGGAIQLVSNTQIVIAGGGGINAGGCGGDHGDATSGGGGGGGSGGAILLEAPVIAIAGGLAVNGGGGGGAEDGMRGANAALSIQRAAGGIAQGAGDGGSGGGVGALAGDQGADDNSSGGGGGGAVGWIRINTFSGTAEVAGTGFTSPSFNDLGTTATQATATVQ